MPRRITSLGDAKVIGTLSWTPDGLSVVYSARRQGRDGAWQTNIASGVTTLLRQADTYSRWPQFSADGSSLFFVSNAEHVFRLWRQTGDRPETGAPLFPELVRSFRMSDDRRSLYFLRRGTQTALMHVDASTNRAIPVYVFPKTSTEINAASTLNALRIKRRSPRSRALGRNMTPGIAVTMELCGSEL
ncbi:MAG TPA: hypothetical protein VGG97_22770 [Bryobacteraceae bacterium]|jgi:hypothetical protein